MSNGIPFYAVREQVLGVKANKKYWEGVAKLKRWHEYCAMKRLKAKREKMLAEKKSKGEMK